MGKLKTRLHGALTFIFSILSNHLSRTQEILSSNSLFYFYIECQKDERKKYPIHHVFRLIKSM